MSKLPTYRRIYKQDYDQDKQDFVEKLALPINNGFDTLYDALNKKITLSDNITSDVIDVNLTVDDKGVPLKTTVFSVSFTDQIGLLIVGNLVNNTNNKSFPSQAPFITWSQSSKTVTIQHVTGLSPNNSYTITIVVFAR